MRSHPLLALFVLLSCSMPFTQARVGENRSELENRLLRDRRAIEYPERYISRKLSDRAVTYRHHLAFFPDGITQAIYYKRAGVGSVSRSDLDASPFPDGWDLHVVFYKNISVFEAYRRNGAALSNAEINALLQINQGNSFWKRVNRKDEQQVWPADFILEDGSMIASRSGNILIFYRPEFEAIIREQVEARRALDAADAEQRAPTSIMGF